MLSIPVKTREIPRFFLYGEPPRDSDAHFFHVETIAARSCRYDWKIGAHAHRDLHQFLVIRAGRGEMQAEASLRPFAAPALLIVPSGMIHGFTFERDTRGHVVTVAQALIEEFAQRDPAFAQLFDAAKCIELASDVFEAHEFEAAVEKLQRELVWPAAAQELAAEARLITALVAAVRAVADSDGSANQRRGPRAELVARFRTAIEENLRSGWSISRYAKALGVTASRLRAACLEIAGKPPARLLNDRLLLEAKRSLIYTNMTVGETAYALGFDDPAYFSRFFSQRVGQSPAAFRRHRSKHD
jgi:AraC family transcriptional regulator, transcriptional activator of pobA